MASAVQCMLTKLKNSIQDSIHHGESLSMFKTCLQSNQVKRFAQESRFGFVVQNLNPFFVRTSQIEMEKWTS